MRVWIVTPDASLDAFSGFLRKHGQEVVGTTSILNQVLQALPEIQADVLLINRYTPGTVTVAGVLWQVRAKRPDLRVVLILGEDDKDAKGIKAAAVSAGVYDWHTGRSINSSIIDMIEKPRQFADIAGEVPVEAVEEMSGVQCPTPTQEPQPKPEAEREDGDRPLLHGVRLFAHIAASRHRAWQRDIGDPTEPRSPAVDDAPQPVRRSRRSVLVAGRNVAVLSAHGGAGATTVSALLAQAFVTNGLQVGLLEAASGGGQLLRFFDQALLEFGIESAQSPEEAVVQCGSMITVLAHGFGATAPLGKPDVERALAYLRGTCDLTLIDAGTGGVGLQTIAPYADLLVLVAEPTPTGLASAMRLVNLVKASPMTQLAGIILNRRPTKRLTAKDLENTLECRVLADIPFLPAQFFHFEDTGRAGHELQEILAPVADALLTRRRAVL